MTLLQHCLLSDVKQITPLSYSLLFLALRFLFHTVCSNFPCQIRIPDSGKLMGSESQSQKMDAGASKKEGGSSWES